jgi:hypothetical protein
VAIRVVDVNKQLPPLPREALANAQEVLAHEKERRRREKALVFVRRAIDVMAGSRLLGRLREDKLGRGE